MHATDVTNASRTLMMDLATLQWDDQILKDLNIPKQMLPQVPTTRCLPCPHLYIEVPKHLPPPHLLDLRLSCLQIRPSSGLFGHVAASSPTGLGGVPVAGVLGDQQAALFGQGRGYSACTYRAALLSPRSLVICCASFASPSLPVAHMSHSLLWLWTRGQGALMSVTPSARTAPAPSSS